MDGTGLLFGLPALMPLLMLGVAGVVLYFAWKAHKRRKAEAAAFAASRGWTYTENVPSLTSRWRSSPFSRGHGRRATNVITGAFHGRQIVSMDYQYTTGSGKNRSTWYFHVVALSLPVPLPWLQLSPDGAGASIAKFFGGQDINFESRAFNDAWRVQAPEGRYAYDFIHPRMMDRLLAPDAVGKTITVEGADIYLAVSGRQQLAAIDHYINLLYGVVDLIPRHLWLNVGHDPLASRS